MDEVALIIIYNHQYNSNIEILEKLYNGRFTNIYHIVPFYTGDESNVIPVYENSYYFQGYVAQAFKSFYKSTYKHYFFVADDLLLHPQINQDNYREYFKVDDTTCFIPGFSNLHDVQGPRPWHRVADAFYWNIKQVGVEATSFWPDNETSRKAFKKFNLDLKPLKFSQIWPTPQSLGDWFSMPKKHLIRYLKNRLLNQQHQLAYPLVAAYSDIFIVSADAIASFVNYCGVTAVTRLFVEVGLPTSMVLAADKIITENDLPLKGRTLWTPADFKFLEPYNQNLNNLLQNFPEQTLYIHPIKLSKWNQ
ncbi:MULTISPECIES: hypothetical protein [Mucilaginibacter]|uniref:hypothetical protein n=1 Tax=Mucilaginibacter TaxID=423349 RepID=UPI000E0DE17E|nr:MULTISPECIES: hypothetical protein [Mucilaginibacter]